MKRHELIVIGAGPAGLSAAIEAKRSGMDVIVLTRTADPEDSSLSRYISSSDPRSITLRKEDLR